MSNKPAIGLRSYESNSSPGKFYQVLIYEDATLSCNCPGWTRCVQRDGSRTCRHVREVEREGYSVHHKTPAALVPSASRRSLEGKPEQIRMVEI